MRRSAWLALLVVGPWVHGCGGDSASPIGTGDAAQPPSDAAAEGHASDTGVTDGGPPDASRNDAAPDASFSDGPDSSAPESGAPDGQPPDAGGCTRLPAPPDRVRKLVVSHPFDASQNPSKDFEVFDLSTSGVITPTGTHFTMGTTNAGRIVFTPDGTVGIVAQDDGSLGVFTFDASGSPHVVAAAYTGSFYASRLVMDPSGARAYVLDDQTRSNGGGIYTIAIGCDGTPTDEGLTEAATLPAGLGLLGGGLAVVAAKDFGSAPSGNDAFLVTWPANPSVLGQANPFGDTQALVSDLAVTEDGLYALIGDNNGFSGIPNRIGIVGIQPSALSSVQVLSPIDDPEAIVASPFDDTLIVTSGFGNAIDVVDSTSGAMPPFSLRGPLTYNGPAPQLPGPAVMVAVGSLEGLALVGENLGVRKVQFAPGSSVTDLGLTTVGSTTAAIVGAIGVQP